MDHPVIVFDGVCNFCNGTVNFIIRQDKKKIFRFAAIQSEAGQKLLEKHNLPLARVDSVILIENGVVFKSSTAALKIFNRLPWYWKWIQLFRIIPCFIRDAVYELFARNRYKLFGRKETCMIPGKDVISRFL